MFARGLRFEQAAEQPLTRGIACPPASPELRREAAARLALRTEFDSCLLPGVREVERVAALQLDLVGECLQPRVGRHQEVAHWRPAPWCG